ncbi:putative metal-binding motif-containing protein [Pyxidicoccus xibeiensis]|uniref:putative metal-binding motif-containing protein n=1 Tax=Pyxidicoccus xibeiensis TaxID=2906759 RepID=UPI0020A7E5C0|nr:putative metal-binding motif-containing protein [Pyxidicoccus xibeiensis]MCP3136945.1 putative metal-binding motif-containing protein [Pyxidicoccus xibeiensis]
MSRLFPWCAVLALVGCSVPSLEELKRERPEVRVNYTSGFTKGCFVVQVVDPAKQGAELERDQVTELDGTSRFSVTVVRKKGWGEKVTLVVTAHEQTCDGPQVDRKSLELDLSGEGTKQPLDLTLETPDVDGDGFVPTSNGGTDCDDRTRDITQRRYYRDGDGDGVGAGSAVVACTAPAGHVASSNDCNDAVASIRPGATETCNEADDNCDGRTDEGFEDVRQSWFLDDDGDTYGRNEAATLSCAAPSAMHVQRSGDCDDTNAAVRPDASELCNNRDDNCAGGVDEIFANKGTACTDTGDGCVGVVDCNATGLDTFCKTPPRHIYYRDVDGDGQGGTAMVSVCGGASMPNGTVANTTDCDDFDADTRTGGTEVCDGLDNNCVNGVDDGLTCNGALRRVTDEATGGMDRYWMTVATGAGGYPVWIAGLGGNLIRRASVGVPFSVATGCGDVDWYAAWVRPTDGHVFLAGEGGRVAEHTGSGCTHQDDLPGTANVTGIWGFVSGSMTTLYMVNDAGNLYTWMPGNAPMAQDDAPEAYYAIHAVDPDRMLVGGRVISTPERQHIAAYGMGALATPVVHTLASPVEGNVNGLWMNTPSLAYGVGDLSAIWKWNGAQAWSMVTPPSGGLFNFTSVAMPPGRDILYVVDKGPNGPGKLQRKTPAGWARAPALAPRNASEEPLVDAELFDIAMTSVGEFWMVGGNGRVYHYPEQ